MRVVSLDTRMRGDDATVLDRELLDGVCEHRKDAVIVGVDLAVRYVRSC